MGPARMPAAMIVPILVLAWCAGTLSAQRFDSPALTPLQVTQPASAAFGSSTPRLQRLPPIDAEYATVPHVRGTLASDVAPARPAPAARLARGSGDRQRPASDDTADYPAMAPASPASPALPRARVTRLVVDDWREGADIPPGFAPWWQPLALRPLRAAPAQTPVEIHSLIVDALRYSARVRAISDHAIIAETAITRAEAQFDVHTFMESKFVRTSVPTGSLLDAGFDVPRLREEDWFYRAGLRQRTVHGGRIEMAQQIGLRDSNSQFFFPDNQGNARLTLNYNQPLLNGAGKAYNRGLIVLANLDTVVAADRTAAELQDHLLEVIEAHWRLYEQRSLLLQRRAHWERAETIRLRLEKRRSVDSLASQVARARAAVATRWSAVIRADAEIRNAESRLRALVNSPDMLAQRAAELIPAQSPASEFLALDPQLAFLTALENRSEIDAATKEIEAARVRLNMAKSELLPVLDLVLETYVNGLRGDSGIGQSWVDQFSRGEPSYSAGLVFEVPLHRRAAKANHQRREGELRQLANQFQAIVETLNSEIEVAVREVETTHAELRTRYLAMIAAQSDADYLQRRWESLPGDDRAASFLLEELLDAQDRLAFGESAFVESQVAYTLSLARLNRATGMLLKHEHVTIVRGSWGGVPSIQFQKEDAPIQFPPTSDPPGQDGPGGTLHEARRRAS